MNVPQLGPAPAPRVTNFKNDRGLHKAKNQNHARFFAMARVLSRFQRFYYQKLIFNGIIRGTPGFNGNIRETPGFNGVIRGDPPEPGVS